MNLKFIPRVSERERAIRQFVIVKNKLMLVCACPVIDNEFRHNIVTVGYFDNVMTKFMINNRIDA